MHNNQFFGAITLIGAKFFKKEKIYIKLFLVKNSVNIVDKNVILFI